MATTDAAVAGKIQPRLKAKYKAEIQQKLQDEFGYTNVTVSYTHLTLPTIYSV